MSASYTTGPIRLTDLRDLPRPSGSLEAFALLCVMSRLAFRQSEHHVACSMEGGRDSPAFSLYRANDEGKQIRWPARIFGDHRTFQACLERESEEDKYRVQLDERFIPYRDIHIWLNDRNISDSIESLAQVEGNLSGARRTFSSGLRLSILRSGDLQYTREIRDALLTQLRAIGYELAQDLPDYFGPPVSPFVKPDCPGDLIPQLRATLDDLTRYGQHSDIIVTIGSQATMALRSHYGARFGVPGEAPAVVFLGVTYPVSLHVIDSLYSRFEDREVAGVAYGADGLRSIAAIIRNWIMPQHLLKFIYFKEHPQDREAAAQLARTRLFHEQRLLIREATPETFQAALEEDDSVLFSWYTIEAILESTDPSDRVLASLLEKKKVVATTRQHCRRGRTFAAVSGDDRSIGATGAELIHGWKIGTIPRLGHHPIAIPRVGYWINREVANRLGIKISQEVIDRAWEVFPERE
jgi:hypothetical protein